MSKQPIQPLYLDKHGTLRFKENKIVRYLLDNGEITLNGLARVDFPREDEEQFAQLIGYSLSGFGDISYVTDETYETAERMYEEGESQLEAENKVLKEKLDKIKSGLREPIAELYGFHPDDLDE